MKKLFLLFTILLPFVLKSQAPPVLTGSNMPFRPQVIRVVGDNRSAITSPKVGYGITWDYSDLAPTPSIHYSYSSSVSRWFPAASYVDTYSVAGLIYDKTCSYNTYCKVETQGVYALGTVTYRQDIDLSDYTLVPGDKIIVPEQYCVFNNPLKIIAFPMTLGVAWDNHYTSYMDYYLTAGSLSLYNAHIRRVSHMERKDTVMGWGNVMVPDMSGNVYTFKVLMTKRTSVQKDSFYLNGSPAPDELLQSICLAQGKTLIINKYMFWRENAAYPVLMLHYMNNDFTKPLAAHLDGNLESPKGVEEQDDIYGMSIYPNPSEGRFTIVFTKAESGEADVKMYDMLGKEFYHQRRVIEDGLNTITMQLNAIPKGEYFLTVKTAGRKYLHKVVIW